MADVASLTSLPEIALSPLSSLVSFFSHTFSSLLVDFLVYFVWSAGRSVGPHSLCPDEGKSGRKERVR